MSELCICLALCRSVASERHPTFLRPTFDADLQSSIVLIEMETATVYPFVLYQVVTTTDLLQHFPTLTKSSRVTDQSPITISVC